jgi:CheY-specific phosphatase CheX
MNASELAPHVSECCSEILDAMYFTEVQGAELRGPAPDDEAGAGPSLTYSLHFAGDISGRFGLRMGLETARNLAANFLGEDGTDLSLTEISEVTGELANMFCGSVMSRVEGEHKFVLSHPEPDAPGSIAAGDRLVSTLATDSGAVTVWVAIEGGP